MNLLAAAACLMIVVIDGDTIRCDGETVRMANIDAPETHQAKCEAERRLGDLATARLAELLEKGPVTIRRGDPADGRLKDRHGRTLALIHVNGRDVGALMIAEGLVRPWTGKRRGWCG